MKKYLKLMALLLFASVTITSCALEQRNNRYNRYKYKKDNSRYHRDHNRDYHHDSRYNDRDHHDNY
jgi:ABC-type nickel/cobalt efflux system permease component RcnA